MSDKHETIADLIAWLRKPREGENAYLTLWRDEIADRLEAAHKRELAVYVLAIAKLRGALVKCRDIALLWQVDEAAGVAGTTDKPHARSAAEAVIDIEFEINAALFATATAEKLSAVGDAAKLREVVKKVLDAVKHLSRTHNDDLPKDVRVVLGGIAFDANAALAAPPRNCDVYTSDELKVKFKSELASELPIANEHEKNLVAITAMGVIDTLFAPATEKEGGAE